MKNHKSAVIFCLLLIFFQARAAAQETVSGGWPVPEKESRQSGMSLGDHISSGPVSVRMDPQALGAPVIRTEDGTVVAPPFPVATPVAIVYPKKAVRRGWQGQAVGAAEILPDGAVGRTALARSSGHAELDNAARDSIKTWKFGTAQDTEDAVPQFVDIPVTFKLDEKS